MQIKNLAYNSSGTINCEIEHPVHGWIPFTAAPSDPEALGAQIYADAVGGLLGPVAAYEGPVGLSPLEIQDGIIRGAQQRLDTFARTRNYDGILSACTYATSSVPKFQAEGQYCVDVRDSTWATLYAILADVQNQVRALPTGYAAIEPELPVLAWPE